MWHVSISRPQAERPLETVAWSRQQKNEAARLAQHLLAGVGGAVEEPGLYPAAYHLRRMLTDAEIAGLDPAWCGLPAVDPGGTPEEIFAEFVQRGLLWPTGRWREDTDR